MLESSRLPPALKRALAAAAPRAPVVGAVRPLGVEGIDRMLAGGGLGKGRLHEIFARESLDEGSATGFAAMLAHVATREPGDASPILWLREDTAQRRCALHGPGLVDLGMDPARLILGVLPDVRALLRAGVDALRCAGLGVVVMELHGAAPLLDLTASRRIALAAEASGVTPLLLRLGKAQPGPSAAQSRWHVAAALSAALEAGAPGHPALRLSLLRQRGGPAGFDWDVEWDRDAVCFRPALPGARLPLSGGGPVPLEAGAGESGREADAGWRIAV